MFNGSLIGPIFSPSAGGGGSLSGFAGVTLLEGLSGVIDLFSPDNSILISTSGQVINLQINPSASIFNSFRPVDSRPVSGSIVPDTSGVYAIGAPSLRFSHVFAQSGIFGLTQYDILTSQPIPINNGAFWLRQQNTSIYRPQYLTPSGTKTIRTVDGYANLIKATTDFSFKGIFEPLYFDTSSVIDTAYYSQSSGLNLLHVWADGLYKVSYNLIFELVDIDGTGGDSIVQSQIVRNGSSTINGSEGYVSIVNPSTLRFGQINKSVCVNLNAGDHIQFQARLYTGIGECNFYEDSSFIIEYIRV